MASDDFTLILNIVPKCVADGESLMLKENLAVFTCGHLICLNCLKDKSELCRRNDDGRFAFYLNDDPHMKKAADYLKVLLPQFVEKQSNELGQKVSNKISELDRLIKSRLAAKPEDVQISGEDMRQPPNYKAPESDLRADPSYREESEGGGESDREQFASSSKQMQNPPNLDIPPYSPANPQPLDLKPSFQGGSDTLRQSQSKDRPQSPTPEEVRRLQEQIPSGQSKNPVGFPGPGNSAKPAQQPMNPALQPTKPPVQEPIKPWEQPNKPVQEPIKPKEQPSKPSQEPIKPREQSSKPTQELIKPIQPPAQPVKPLVQQKPSPKKGCCSCCSGKCTLL
jgi:hypothetical protein